MIRLLVVTAMLLLCFPAMSALGSEHYSPSTLSVDVGTDVSATYVCIHPYTAWSVAISTSGSTEFDAGVNFPSGGWNIRNLMGMDFSQGTGGKVESGSFYNRFSVIHLRSPHIESLVNLGVAVNFSRQSGCSIQQIISKSIRGTPLLGGVRYDLQTWFDGPPTTWLGPLLELDANHKRLSLAPQLQIGSSNTRYLLSFVTFF